MSGEDWKEVKLKELPRKTQALGGANLPFPKQKTQKKKGQHSFLS